MSRRDAALRQAIDTAAAALDNLGRPDLKELALQAMAGDRALDGLTRQQEQDTLTVLRCLADAGACSVFAATGGGHLGDTFARLERWRLVEPLDRRAPWAAVRLTARGRFLLDGAMAPPVQKGKV